MGVCDMSQPRQTQQRVTRLVIRIAPNVTLPLSGYDLDLPPASPIRSLDIGATFACIEPVDEILDRALLRPGVTTFPLNVSNTPQILATLRQTNRRDQHCWVTRQAAHDRQPLSHLAAWHPLTPSGRAQLAGAWAA